MSDIAPDGMEALAHYWSKVLGHQATGSMDDQPHTPPLMFRRTSEFPYQTASVYCRDLRVARDAWYYVAGLLDERDDESLRRTAEQFPGVAFKDAPYALLVLLSAVAVYDCGGRDG